MSLLDREGTFMASIADRGIGLSKNGALEFTVNYHVQQELQGSQWVDCEQQSIIGRHYIIKTDGSPNTTTIDSVKAAFGWDGADATALDTMELPLNHLVQIVTGFEQDQQGNDRIRVRFVNPADYAGGIRKASADERKQIAAKFNPKLRAVAGTPAAAPKPKTAPPTAPAARTAPPAKPAAKKATKDEAWSAFVEGAEKLGMTGEQIESAWTAVLEKKFPGKEDAAMTGDDWAWVKANGAAEAAGVPF